MIAVLVGALGASPAFAGADVGVVRERVIYGTDDREEWRDLPRGALSSATRDGVAALIRASRLGIADGRVSLSAPPLGVARNLCDGERFAAQPSAAACTGALVDGDLVLTAGHCVPDDADCAHLAIAFDFAEGTAGTVALDERSVFACRAIVSGTQARDWAGILLDRAVAGRVPLDLADGAPQHDDVVVGAGHGQGVPLKIDPHAVVVGEPHDAQFDVATDAFEGNSGSPILTREGKLLGIVVSGRQDYERRGACFTSRSVESDGLGETVLSASSIVDELCASGWPSERLCGSPPACGDAICSGGESSDTCVADCPAAVCGDGTCEGVEHARCATDCGPAAQGDAPFEWYCAPSRYAGSDGCDCACGTVDPDCTGACEHFGPLRLSEVPAGVVIPAARAGGGCAVGRDAPERGAPFLVLVAAAAARRRSARRRSLVASAALLLGLAVAACTPQAGSQTAASAPRPAYPAAPPGPYAGPPGPGGQPFHPGLAGQSPASAPSAGIRELASRAVRGVLRLVIDRGAPAGSQLGLGELKQALTESGSAVLLAPDGLAVTNEHITRDAAAIFALTDTGALREVDMVAADADTDLAVVRIKGDLSGLEPAVWAEAGALHAGDAVVSVGNAFGRGLTVSTGIVAAVERSGLSHVMYEDFVLTDATVAKGVSGGALVGLDGRLVGIITGNLVDKESGAGFGLAVSVRLSRRVIDSLVRTGRVDRGNVGLETIDMPPAIARKNRMSAIAGPVVTTVQPGGPADRSGVRPGDVIVAVGDWHVTDRGQLRAALSTIAGGQSTTVQILRGKAPVTLRLSL